MGTFLIIAVTFYIIWLGYDAYKKGKERKNRE